MKRCIADCSGYILDYLGILNCLNYLIIAILCFLLFIVSDFLIVDFLELEAIRSCHSGRLPFSDSVPTWYLEGKGFEFLERS
jgi:hypothetical protein